MKREEIVEYLETEYPEGEFILYDDVDSAFVGVVERNGMEPIALYDYDKCIASYIDDGMEYDEAVEHFGFNVIGGWVGEGTPAFVKFIDGNVDFYHGNSVEVLYQLGQKKSH